MSRESALWDWLAKARLQFSRDELHMTRIENAILAGMPDVEGVLRLPDARPEQFWLELKSQERPARSSTPIRFKVRQAQIDWIEPRWRVGANVFWLLQVGSGHERRLFLAPGPLGPQLLRGLTEAALAVECVNFGIFSKTALSQKEVLKRVISCRFNHSNALNQSSRSPA